MSEPLDRKTIESDIADLEGMAKQAAEVGDWESVESLDETIYRAKESLAGTAAETQTEVPAVEAASGPEAFGLGLQRQGGRFWAGAKEVGQLAEKAYKGALGQEVEGRKDISAEERVSEAEYKQRVRNHPSAGFVGEMTGMLPFGGGRGPARAAVRGAVGGLLSYNEDPVARGTQAVGGALMNQFGHGILGRGRPTSVMSKAKRTGMELLPEQRAPTFFKKSVEDLDRLGYEAARTARSNNETITSEALRLMGERGKMFVDETFANVNERSVGLITKAMKGQERITLGTRFNVGLLLHRLRQEEKIVRSPKVINMLRRFEKRADVVSGEISPTGYQELRSEITKTMRRLPEADAEISYALGDVVGLLDDAAENSLGISNPAALAQFREGRRIYRHLMQFSKRGIVDDRNGQINPGKLRELFKKDDRGGYLLNRDQSDLYDMLRVDAKTPRGRERFDMFGNYKDMSVSSGHGPGVRLGSGVIRALERPVVGASRLPQRAIEGSPLAITVPTIKEAMPSDTSDKVIEALMSGSNEGFTQLEIARLNAKRKLLAEALSARQENQ